jgi:uroporphyrinogen-III synthase
VDAVVFTSAVQIQNLNLAAVQFGAADRLNGLLNRCTVASVGPVCSKALLSFGVRPSIEANPPKLGPLLSALADALQSAPVKRER